MILAALLALAAQTAPAAESRPIVLGTAFHWRSPALGEDRVVNVVLPDDYAKQPGKRYPVLYIIDGGVDQDLIHIAGVEKLGAAWGRSADAIVVGIATKDRRRELTGATHDADLLKQYPTAGHAADFRRFIRDEVKPFVKRTYRTNGEDAVIGESLAGLFILETYLTEPTLFGNYAAISPSLWWDKQALANAAASDLGRAQDGRRLYFAAAGEGPEMDAADRRVVGALSAKAKGWCFAERPDLTHSTIYQQLSPQALQFVLSPPKAPPADYGFEVKCSAGM